MATENEKLEGTLAAIRCYVPKFSLKLKSESITQQAIGLLMAFIGNKNYMSCYWTTLGKTVYRPTACNLGALEGEWKVLFHEGRHADDCYKVGPILYDLAYLFPQVIGIFGILYALALIPALLLGAPGALLWGILSLLFLAPVPAPFRAVIEARGYLVSMCVDFWSGTIGDEEEYLDRLAQRFTTGQYYFMFPFGNIVRSYFSKRLEALKLGCLDLDSYLTMCRMKALSFK